MRRIGGKLDECMKQDWAKELTKRMTGKWSITGIQIMKDFGDLRDTLTKQKKTENKVPGRLWT
jgi:hypothetical protein